MDSDRFLTVTDVARQLSINPETVRRWLRAGRLRGFTMGSDKAGWRVRESDLMDFVVSLERQSDMRIQTEANR